MEPTIDLGLSVNLQLFILAFSFWRSRSSAALRPA